MISTTAGVDTVLVLSTGYTVTGAGAPAGGTVAPESFGISLTGGRSAIYGRKAYASTSLSPAISISMSSGSVRKDDRQNGRTTGVARSRPPKRAMV